MAGGRSASVIIRARNEARSLRRSLGILRRQRGFDEVEVVVVYTESEDDTLEVAVSGGARVVEVPEEEFTWGRGLNAGISEARHELVCLLSAHCYPATEDWLLRITAPLGDPGVAAAYGRQVPLPGVDPYEEVDLMLTYPPLAPLAKGYAFSNANACIRRSVWEEFPFDETLMAAEDGEWGFRVRAAGYRVVYVPDAVVFHSHPLDLERVYTKWYWRARETVRVLGGVRRFRMLRRDPRLAAVLTAMRLFYWLFLDVANALLRGYLDALPLAARYELVRQAACYRGTVDAAVEPLRTGPRNR